MTIGERIKRRRIQLGYSQTWLADKIGISKQQMYKYENGVITNIPSDKIEDIANALHCTPSYLMGWDADQIGVHIENGRYVADEATELKFALWDSVGDLSAEDVQAVLDYAEYIKMKKNNKNR